MVLRVEEPPEDCCKGMKEISGEHLMLHISQEKLVLADFSNRTLTVLVEDKLGSRHSKLLFSLGEL